MIICEEMYVDNGLQNVFAYAIVWTMQWELNRAQTSFSYRFFVSLISDFDHRRGIIQLRDSCAQSYPTQFYIRTYHALRRISMDRFRNVLVDLCADTYLDYCQQHLLLTIILGIILQIYDTGRSPVLRDAFVSKTSISPCNL